MRDCAAVIVDEAPMTHKAAYEAIDITLKNLRGNDDVFGGIPTLLCGDFRQVLPVIKNGTRSNIIDAILKHSYLWDNITSAKLQTNMRVHLHNDQDAASFSKFLNDIGDGVYPIHAEMNLITLPESISNVGQNKLTDEIYADITEKWQDHE